MNTFSRQGYVAMLTSLKEDGYEFVSFSDINTGADDQQKECLLRHDVDLSMQKALQMARLEAALGIKATYFFMLRSPMYNLLGRHGVLAAREIASLGHHIGLHFDSAAAKRISSQAEHLLSVELRILEDVMQSRIDVFSIHQPSQDDLKRPIQIPGTINTYGSVVNSTFKYVSDSNRQWRNETPQTLSKQGFRKIHLLTHPIWWMNRHDRIEDCWNDAIVGQFSLAQAQLLETERAYGSHRHIRVTQDQLIGETFAKKVRLRAPQELDSVNLFKWINDKEVVQFNAQFKPVDHQAHDVWFKQIQLQGLDSLFRMILDVETDKVIGSCQLIGIDHALGKAELRIRVGEKDYWSKGYGYAALKELIAYADINLNLDEIYLFVFEDNTRAINAYLKCGFQKDVIRRAEPHQDSGEKKVISMTLRFQ
jgi:RimJ/RimL family protein N-acetyltransferase